MIKVHGLLGEPSAALVEDASQADFVVATEKHLEVLSVDADKRIKLGVPKPTIERIQGLPSGADVVVVSSGDPSFFGMVRHLRAAGLRPKVTPGISSVAAAFAAVGLPWDDAAVVSVHARPLHSAIKAARRYGKVAVFTSVENGIQEIAAGLEGFDRCFVLAESLGTPEEQVRILTAQQALEVEPIQPNVVLILDRHPDAEDAPWAGTVAGPVPLSHAPSPIGEDPVIGQIMGGNASAARADHIDQVLGVTTRRYTKGAAEGLPRAWQECDLIISHLALGATTRIAAPLLANKATDPGLVVIDEAGRFAVPLVGGHAGGANALAEQLADGLGATAVVTTATDSMGIPGLDNLGWGWSGDIGPVTRAIIDGRPVSLTRVRPWPLPALPSNVSSDAQDPVGRLVVSDETVADDPLPTVVLRPPSLVAGMGCKRGTSVTELRELLETTLAEAGLAAGSVAAITSVAAKADEAGLKELADAMRVPFVTYPADELASYEVPNPSEAAAEAVGTPSVSEASVLAHSADLVVPKQRGENSTCAIGRIPARGHLSVVGLGPGQRDLTTPRAQEAIRNAEVVVGYGAYIDQISDLIRPGAEVNSSGPGYEEYRTSLAIEKAREGKSVALVSSGDPAIYAMASPTLEQGTEGIDVEIVPGVTASLAVSAILGAPLGHDHATLSLSDLHTDWDTIERRLKAAAEADLVTVFYNPRSRTRLKHLPRALEIFSEHRPATTPVAVVEQACRPGQKVTVATLADFDPEWVNMNSLVLVGSSTTRLAPTGTNEEFLVTPRDYKWMKA